MDDLVEMTVDSIRVHMSSGQHVVILKEEKGEHYLPIWIGVSEANAIALKISDIVPERPITHDLLVNILEASHVTVDKIVVTSLDNEVFYAQVVAHTDNKTLAIDARPSDAIAIAVRVHSPILVAKSVIEQAGIIPGENDDDDDETAEKPSEERLTQMRDWINHLNLPDLGSETDQS